MKTYTLQRVGITLSFLCMPFAAFAAEFMVAKEDQPVEITMPITEDLYAVGSTVTISSPIEGDAFVAGQTVIVQERIGQDIVSGGQNITVSNSVLDDAVLVGNTVTIEGTVEGDVFAAGQFVTVAEQAHIGEDAYLAGQSIRINGGIDGNVKTAATKVIISSHATINGGLTVYGDSPIIEDGARIQGEVTVKERKAAEEKKPRSLLSMWVSSTLSLFLVGAALVYITPRLTKHAYRLYRANTGKSFIAGIVWTALFIPVTILALFTVIGWPFVIIIPLLSIVMYILAAGLAAITIGSWILAKLPPGRAIRSETEAEKAHEIHKPSWSHALLGAVVYETVRLIGPIGWTITFVFLLIGFGALILTLWDFVSLRRPKSATSSGGET